MAVVRMVKAAEVPVTRRGGPTNGQAQIERQHATDNIKAALAQREPSSLELALGPDERDETLKGYYRAAAKALGVKVRFKAGATRLYVNRKGNEELEAEVLYVEVAA